jgi:glutaredoxin
MAPKTPKVFAYLLQKCPYSQKMAKLLEKDQKQWVRRDSPQYHELKEKYGVAVTFPIVLRGEKWVGGYTEYVHLTSR